MYQILDLPSVGIALVQMVCWSGSVVSGRVEVIWSLTSLSMHFMMRFISVTLAILGTGTMLALLKHVETADWHKD